MFKDSIDPNHKKWLSFLSALRDYLCLREREFVEDIQQTPFRVFVFGGCADPERWGTVRKDIDIAWVGSQKPEFDQVAISVTEHMQDGHMHVVQDNPAQPYVDVTEDVKRVIAIRRVADLSYVGPPYIKVSPEELTDRHVGWVDDKDTIYLFSPKEHHRSVLAAMMDGGDIPEGMIPEGMSHHDAVRFLLHAGWIRWYGGTSERYTRAGGIIGRLFQAHLREDIVPRLRKLLSRATFMWEEVRVCLVEDESKSDPAFQGPCSEFIKRGMIALQKFRTV